MWYGFQAWWVSLYGSGSIFPHIFSFRCYACACVCVCVCVCRVSLVVVS